MAFSNVLVLSSPQLLLVCNATGSPGESEQGIVIPPSPTTVDSPAKALTYLIGNQGWTLLWVIGYGPMAEYVLAK